MNNVYRIGIVGADGLNKAWTPERKIEARSVIRAILSGQCSLPYLKEGDKRIQLELVEWKKKEDIEWNERFPEANGWRSNAILVSGHCPVGKLQHYCCTCDRFVETDIERETIHKDHIVIEVYDRGGADTFAEIIATKLGIKKEIYPAEVNQWEDLIYDIQPYETYESVPKSTKTVRKKGYKSRNIQIVIASDILYDIEPKGSCKHCGGRGWQAQYVELQCNYCKGTGNYSGGYWTLKEHLKQGKEGYQIVIE